MRISDLFPSRYLSPADLQGREARVKITSLTLVTMKDPRSKQDNVKPVLHFEGKQKGLVLNKTNAMAIAAILGDETDQWVGGQITLFPTRTTVAGVQKDCIRVRPNVDKSK